MRRRWRDYLKGGSVAIGIALSAWGIFLTVKNDTKPIEIQERFLWLSLFVVFIIILLLVIALFNQDRKLREVDEYHIERCYNDNGVIRLKVAFIPILMFDYVVTIATENDQREEVIGIGKVTNVKPESYLEIELIRRNEKHPLWKDIESNDKAALNKAYILPTVKAVEVKP